MRLRLSLIVLILSATVQIGAGLASAVAPAPALNEFSLFAWINQIRTAPMAAAQRLGVNTAAAANSAELQAILATGLPALEYDGNLYLAARTACASQLAQAGVWPQVPLTARLEASGYQAATAGEITAAIVFGDDLAEGQMLERLAAQMLEDDLAAPAAARTILNPGFQVGAISLQAGKVVNAGRIYTIYRTVAVIATPAYSTNAYEFLALINQARQDPQAAAGQLGQTLPPGEESLGEGLPPLAPQAVLRRAAVRQAGKVLASGGVRRLDEEREEVAKRIEDEGYVLARDKRGALVDPPAEISAYLESYGLSASMDIATPLYGAYFVAELSAPPSQRLLLNPAFQKIGLSFVTQEDVGASLLVRTKHLAVADAAVQEEGAKPVLLGMVYEAKDARPFAVGAGLAGVYVRISGGSRVIELFTNSVGGFSVALKPGDYTVRAYPGDKVETASVALRGSNKALWFPVE